jgi:PAS domain S-box-containing protein
VFKRLSPPLKNAVLIVFFFIIIAESIGFLIAYHTKIPYSFWIFIDLTALVVLLIPLLFLFVYKPLSVYSKKISLLNEELILSKEALAKNELKFRLIADFSCDWEYWRGIDEAYLYVSPSCTSITGYSPEEFYQNNELLKKIIHPDDLTKWETHRHGVTKKGELEPVKFRLITKSGDVRWIDHVCRHVHDENGKDLGIRGSNRDVTKLELLKKEMKILQGFLPICASCKKIRDDKGYWSQIESYISDHSDAQFSHGICPDCAKKLYPELDLFKDK